MWYDSEAMSGSKKSNVTEQDIFYGPNNKMEEPCTTCPLVDTCVAECKAFKTWCDKGSYNEKFVGVFKKGLTVMN